MVAIRIPTPLRTLSSNKDEVQVEGPPFARPWIMSNVGTPGFKERLLNDKGNLRVHQSSFTTTRMSGSATVSTQRSRRATDWPSFRPSPAARADRTTSPGVCAAHSAARGGGRGAGGAAPRVRAVPTLDAAGPHVPCGSHGRALAPSCRKSTHWCH